MQNVAEQFFRAQTSLDSIMLANTLHEDVQLRHIETSLSEKIRPGISLKGIEDVVQCFRACHFQWSLTGEHQTVKLTRAGPDQLRADYQFTFIKRHPEESLKRYTFTATTILGFVYIDKKYKIYSIDTRCRETEIKILHHKAPLHKELNKRFENTKPGKNKSDPSFQKRSDGLE